MPALVVTRIVEVRRRNTQFMLTLKIENFTRMLDIFLWIHQASVHAIHADDAGTHGDQHRGVEDVPVPLRDKTRTIILH